MQKELSKKLNSPLLCRPPRKKYTDLAGLHTTPKRERFNYTIMESDLMSN